MAARRGLAYREAMRFLLPPSTGAALAPRHVPELVAALADAVPGLVVDIAPDYTALGDAVVAGRCEAAWVPPIVGARVELAGGRVVLRAVRHGTTRYRAGLVCRRGETFDPAKASTLTAAWVDEDSAAGHLLARSWLQQQHVDSLTGFRRVIFTHSYVASLEAVADGRADLASIFCTVDGPVPHCTLDTVDVGLREKLQVFAYTDDTATDGVAIGPGVDATRVEALVGALERLSQTPAGVALLGRLMQCEGLRRPAAGAPTSRSLAGLASG
jgi:ABC-type phosphate/phosphonate transport system substrate-binding protein